MQGCRLQIAQIWSELTSTWQKHWPNVNKLTSHLDELCPHTHTRVYMPGTVVHVIIFIQADVWHGDRWAHCTVSFNKTCQKSWSSFKPFRAIINSRLTMSIYSIFYQYLLCLYLFFNTQKCCNKPVRFKITTIWFMLIFTMPAKKNIYILTIPYTTSNSYTPHTTAH